MSNLHDHVLKQERLVRRNSDPSRYGLGTVSRSPSPPYPVTSGVSQLDLHDRTDIALNNYDRQNLAGSAKPSSLQHLSPEVLAQIYDHHLQPGERKSAEASLLEFRDISNTHNEAFSSDRECQLFLDAFHNRLTLPPVQFEAITFLNPVPNWWNKTPPLLHEKFVSILLTLAVRGETLEKLHMVLSRRRTAKKIGYVWENSPPLDNNFWNTIEIAKDIVLRDFYWSGPVPPFPNTIKLLDRCRLTFTRVRDLTPTFTWLKNSPVQSLGLRLDIRTVPALVTFDDILPWTPNTLLGSHLRRLDLRYFSHHNDTVDLLSLLQHLLPSMLRTLESLSIPVLFFGEVAKDWVGRRPLQELVLRAQYTCDKNLCEAHDFSVSSQHYNRTGKFSDKHARFSFHKALHLLVGKCGSDPNHPQYTSVSLEDCGDTFFQYLKVWERYHLQKSKELLSKRMTLLRKVTSWWWEPLYRRLQALGGGEPGAERHIRLVCRRESSAAWAGAEDEENWRLTQEYLERDPDSHKRKHLGDFEEFCEHAERDHRYEW